MRISGRVFLVFLLITACVGVDQAAKELAREHLSGGKVLSLAGGTLKLDYHENKGGVFRFE